MMKFISSAVSAKARGNTPPSKPACRLFLSTSPPDENEVKALVDGLVLDGAPLQPPIFFQPGWKEGQVFEASDDPDRTELPWQAPKIFRDVNPFEQQKKTSVEELVVPGQGSFARIIHGVLDESACAHLVAAINDKGFTPALLNVGRGRQQLDPLVRNGHRVIVDSAELSNWLLEVLRPHLPEEMMGGRLVDLNERLRFLCYTPGQEFAPHMDGNYRRPREHPNAGDSSRVTVQIYLHDVPAGNGGATTFDFGRAGGMLPCQPKVGSALLFTQDLVHEGSLLTHGLKYTVRTEAMYGTR